MILCMQLYLVHVHVMQVYLLICIHVHSLCVCVCAACVCVLCVGECVCEVPFMALMATLIQRSYFPLNFPFCTRPKAPTQTQIYKNEITHL